MNESLDVSVGRSVVVWSVDAWRCSCGAGWWTAASWAAAVGNTVIIGSCVQNKKKLRPLLFELAWFLSVRTEAVVKNVVGIPLGSQMRLVVS